MKKTTLLSALILGLLSTNLQGQIKTFDMNETGNMFELGFTNFGVELGGTYFLNNYWGIKYNVGGMPFWKNSMMLWSFSESENVREFEYPQQAYTYYDSYNYWDENFIQGSWLGLGITYKLVVNDKLTVMPSLEYQAVNEIYAQVGSGNTSSGAYEDFIEYVEPEVYFYPRAGLAVGYKQFVVGAVYTPWDAPIQTPVMLRLGYSFKKSNTLDFN
jgi:hypothetical protein